MTITAIGTIWLISGMTPGIAFAEFAEQIEVVFANRFAALAALGVLLIAITLILRIIGIGRNRD